MVYPGKQVGGLEADMMASNELKTHAFLQTCPQAISQNIQILLGGFETKTGEQWLAFRNNGKYCAADYAKVSSEKLSKNLALKEQRFWNPFEQEQYIKRKRLFIITLLQGAFRGLAYMHDNERLHQSIGPTSVVLNGEDALEAKGTESGRFICNLELKCKNRQDMDQSGRAIAQNGRSSTQIRMESTSGAS